MTTTNPPPPHERMRPLRTAYLTVRAYGGMVHQSHITGGKFRELAELAEVHGERERQSLRDAGVPADQIQVTVEPMWHLADPDEIAIETGNMKERTAYAWEFIARKREEAVKHG